MASVILKNINKIYENRVQAVFDFNLEIEDKEFIVFVGPSGCGKSTTLRMIAGLEEITSGELKIDGELMNEVAPKNRNIAMVFQSYALYPHMSVYDNISFGMKIRKRSREEMDKAVKYAAKILEIEPYLDRKPRQLSGGQRQRVALGRAIVRNAKVFLMDEPLSNLDAKLRVQMRSEIIKLHERIGATTIYVTHDQTEAMTMASRIVVMKDGYIQQVGTPEEIYHAPANRFVAGFIGAPAMNFLLGEIKNGCFVTENLKFRVPASFRSVTEEYEGKEVVLGIRPEDIHLEAEGYVTSASCRFQMLLDVRELLGHEYILHGTTGGQPLLAKVSAKNKVTAHTQVEMQMDLEKIHFFDPQTEERIREHMPSTTIDSARSQI